MMTVAARKKDDVVDAPTMREAAQEMLVYYAQTGTYRAEDVLRVLGDPRDGVGQRADDAYAMACRRLK